MSDVRRLLMTSSPLNTIEGALPFSVASSKAQVAKGYRLDGGNGIVMMQQCNFDKSYNTFENVVKNGREYSFDLKGGTYLYNNIWLNNRPYIASEGLKFLIIVSAKADTANALGLYVFGSTITFNVTTEWKKYAHIVTLSNPNNYNSQYNIQFRVNESVSGRGAFKDGMFFNLTAMQMEDVNTADEFAARLGYDSIEDLPYVSTTDGSVVIGTGENQTDGRYKIPITNSLGETTNIYLDRPLMKIDDVADYIDYVNGKVVRKIGVVDLGTLTWVKSSLNVEGFASFYSSGISNAIKIPNSTNDNFNGICHAFRIGYYKEWIGLVKAEFIQCPPNGCVGIRCEDNNNSDVVSFKTSMQGVLLYYELATPTEESITLPSLSLMKGTNVLDADCVIKPSNLILSAKGIKKINN